MLMHAWELDNTYFDYFFFKENCSYHILSLLEVADPRLHLTDRFIAWTVPADTVRVITEQPGLVAGIAYRPSRSTQIRRKRSMLTEAEDQRVRRLIVDPTAADSADFTRLPPDRQTFVLDLATDYLQYLSATAPESDAAPNRDRTRLERFKLADIVSLTPVDALFKSPSWKISAGYDTVSRHDCRYCGNANVNGGIGAAAESHWLRHEMYFAFAELDANYSHAFDENHRIGGGGTAGLLADLTERWAILLSTTYLRYPVGEDSDNWRVAFQQRFTLQKDLALRLEFNHLDRHDNEAVLSVQVYY